MPDLAKQFTREEIEKVDFIAIKHKQKYLIEIKQKTSHYGIEQLLRYRGISKEDSCKMILITGIEDPKHQKFRN